MWVAWGRLTSGAFAQQRQDSLPVAALDRVPREARMLMALHYVNGLGYRELAAIRGISVNTVKSQLARGKAILKQALQAGGHDGSD